MAKPADFYSVFIIGSGNKIPMVSWTDIAVEFNKGPWQNIMSVVVGDSRYSSYRKKTSYIKRTIQTKTKQKCLKVTKHGSKRLGDTHSLLL
jgi:galactokinase